MVKAHPSAAKVARRRDARLEPPPIIAQGERRSTSLERIRPQRIFAPGENRRSRKAPAKAGPRRAVHRTNSTSGAFGRWSAYVPNEFGLQRPSANGWPAPTGKGFCVGGGRRLARSALEGRFQSAQKPSAGGRPAPTGKGFCVGGGRRPARQRLGGPISIGVKAFGRWLACADREGVLRRRRPTPGAPAPWKADFNRRKSLRPTVGLRRPESIFCVGGGRRPARQRLEGPISIGAGG
jgi:hypothetical protein